MVARNDITGDVIQSRQSSKAYAENLDKIFGDKTAERERKAKEKAEYFARLNADNTGTSKNEYYDTLSTEDCFEFEDKVSRNNVETQEVMSR
jgi:hypothetical protein